MSDFLEARQRAESRSPLIKQFRGKVQIAPSKVRNKGGLGEFVEPDHPSNPLPGKYTITIGENSKGLKGGVSDTIIADMVHAAGEFSPDFKRLKKEMVSNFGEKEISLAKRIYDREAPNQTGTNFSSFKNFLNGPYSDGIVQHLLLPENSEIEGFKQASPKAIPSLNAIEHLFKTGTPKGKLGELMNE